MVSPLRGAEKEVCHQKAGWMSQHVLTHVPTDTRLRGVQKGLRRSRNCKRGFLKIKNR